MSVEMDPSNPCRPREALHGGASARFREDISSNEQINQAIRERVWYPAPQVVTLYVDDQPPRSPVCYRPEGAPGDQRSGSCATTERPTEGETNHAMNEALRSAARQILGK